MDFENQIDTKISDILKKCAKTDFGGIYINIKPKIDKKKPTLVVVIGPTGVGKSTFINTLIENGYSKVVTVTTRPRRDTDMDGDYIWVDDEKMPDETYEEYAEKLQIKYDLLEFNIFAQNVYGTPKKSLEDALKNGRAVIGVENKGAEQIKKHFDENANVLIFFLLPDSFEQIKNRIAESRNDVDERIKIASREIENSYKLTNFYIHNTELPIYLKEFDNPLEQSKQNLLNLLDYLLN